MRRIISMLLLAVLVLALPASCRKQAVVTIEANTIDAPSSGLTRALGINTNYPWDAVASDSWIVLHNTTGNPGDAVIGIYVMNNSMGEDREGTITVTCEEVTTTVTVRQSANDALNLDGNTIQLTYVGGEVIIPVEANVEYSVDIKDSWIVDGGTRVMSHYQHAITVARNESEEDREAVIVFRTPAGVEKTYYIKQLGYSPAVVIRFTGSEFTVPALSGTEGLSATIIWGDGSSEDYNPGVKHSYMSEGEYDINIIGKGITGYEMADVKGVSFMDLTDF